MFCSAISAQNIQILGKIISADSIPVPNVSITNDKTRAGTTSDKNGFFNMATPIQKTTLSFSHVSYVGREIIISETTLQEAKEQGFIHLDVIMEKRIIELAPSVITYSKVEIAWEDTRQWILDYELVEEDGLLLLLEEKNRTYLQLGNGEQELICKIIMHNAYEELYKDCYGRNHVLSNDSAYQVFSSNETLTLIYPESRKIFDGYIPYAIINTDNYLYTKESARHNQLITYSKVNKETKSTEILATNYQEKQSDFNASYMKTIEGLFARENPMASSSTVAAFRSALISSRDFDDFRNASSSLGDVSISYGLLYTCSFYKNSLEKPPYSLLAKINDSLFFFDHLNNKLQKYDINGNHVSDREISYHKASGWAKEIIVNEEHTRCFAKFVRGGYTTLREINPNTGEFVRDIALKRHIFPSKIKVRGDYVYYLCKDYYKGQDKYFLWKQRIE